jgi:hypothetical protein
MLMLYTNAKPYRKYSKPKSLSRWKQLMTHSPGDSYVQDALRLDNCCRPENLKVEISK